VHPFLADLSANKLTSKSFQYITILTLSLNFSAISSTFSPFSSPGRASEIRTYEQKHQSSYFNLRLLSKVLRIIWRNHHPLNPSPSDPFQEVFRSK
jgi:hypothetical protein